MTATERRVRRPRDVPRSRLRAPAIVAILGPGLIAANAGNDAGGVATYASVGASYGYSLLWALILITISLALVQEMAFQKQTLLKRLTELVPAAKIKDLKVRVGTVEPAG